MKNPIIITITTLIACSLLLASCSQELIEPSSAGEILSRATTPGTPSETNPTLLTDWENCRFIVLSNVTANGENEKIDAPWVDGSSSNLDEDFRKDIKKKDGWIMLFHTFCESNTSIDLRYLFFYNRYSGYLKIFSYVPTTPVSTKSIWKVCSDTKGLPLSIFSDYERFSNTLTEIADSTIYAQDFDNVKKWSKHRH